MLFKRCTSSLLKLKEQLDFAVSSLCGRKECEGSLLFFLMLCTRERISRFMSLLLSPGRFWLLYHKCPGIKVVQTHQIFWFLSILYSLHILCFRECETANACVSSAQLCSS